MKKLLVVLSFLSICTFAIAQTISIDWKVDGNTYAQNTCEYGGTLTVPATPPTKYGYTFQGWGRYIPLEYIESTGIQWIDTGFIANNGMVLDAKVLPIDGTMVVGSIGPSNINPRYTRNVVSYSREGFYVPQKLNNYSTYYQDAGTTPAVIHFDTKGTNFYCTINGNVVVNMTTDVFENQTTTVKISYSDYSATARAGRYYYVKIKNSNNTLVRDFIPARNSGDGSVGMYDKVSGTFFPNAGTGEFVAGPVVQ